MHVKKSSHFFRLRALQTLANTVKQNKALVKYLVKLHKALAWLGLRASAVNAKHLVEAQPAPDPSLALSIRLS
ncbi:MAG: hypothetical protein CUN50_04855 [Candidatus Thermofonsia Clade 1 bacterium]|uniref:Uncharacterized protein n=1 Tax=Candidatus Thermofonsia Clade 1 bacterium TaxID=2364210 RepID=A0A2M8PXK2_9CHLR|nr:MAG: hypothetical protein CUN50_04855 [Candidatus Thermofonsia Clade 1 bacterium]